MDNMYREGRRRGDKGFVWTCKGEEEMLEDDRRRERVTDEEEEVRAKLESVRIQDNVGDEGGAKCKDVAAGRDKPDVCVVYGEQRMEGLRLIDLRPQQGPMPPLEDAEDEQN